MMSLPPSPTFFFILLTLSSLILLSSPVCSINCASEKFTNNKVYSNCNDLPFLNSTLHWTFNPQNSSLIVAFVAPPATPDGWIAWAINPTATGMIGSQALIAFKNSTGAMVVKTYNISSYAPIKEGKILFEVPESSAEFSGGVIKLFATVKLPEKTTEVNQVWQVGGSVKDGVPVKHGFLPANLKAMSKLQLEGKAVSNGTTAGSPVVAPSSSASTFGNAGVYVIPIFFGCLFGFF